MALAPPPASPPTPSPAPRKAKVGSGRVLGGLLTLIGLGLVLGLGAVWLATRPAPTPAVPAPLVQSLVYQDVGGAILSVDATTNVTRTLLPTGRLTTRLLDTSPDGLSLAYIESSRPTTATLWYLPVTNTVRLRGRGGTTRTVRLPAGAAEPQDGLFLDDDTLAVTTRRARSSLRDLYLYAAAEGTSRLLATNVARIFPLPEQGLVLYTHELTGPGVIDPGGNARVVELAALEVSGALTPQPLAAWSLSQPGDPVQIWPDPAHNTVFYTTIDTPPTLNRAWTNAWFPVRIMALPIHPLGTPQPVATFTSESVGGAVELGAAGHTLTWVKARPTVLPSTPFTARLSTPIPQGWGMLRWDGDKPSLVERPLPDPNLPLSFVVGSNLLTIGQDPLPGTALVGLTVIPNGGTAVPDRATIAAANRTPTPPPPVAGRVQVLDPATGQSSALAIAFNTNWAKVGPIFQSGEAAALDDRLLLIGPDPAQGTPVPGTPPAPAHLLLATQAGDGWRMTSLGAVGTPTLLVPIEIQFYGLTPDRTAAILSRPGARRDPARVTQIYRVPLAGGDWTLLGQAVPDSPILPHRPGTGQ